MSTFCFMDSALTALLREPLGFLSFRKTPKQRRSASTKLIYLSLGWGSDFGWGSEAIERFSVYKQTCFAFKEFFMHDFSNMSS